MAVIIFKRKIRRSKENGWRRKWRNKGWVRNIELSMITLSSYLI